jgi:predicted metal-dependent phosphoesterase TrpH
VTRVDLHLHTTASDGLRSVDDLVREAVDVGLSVMAITDHDTMASVPRASALCAQAGVTLVPGIEITAMEAGRDIHVLGYFLDAAHDGLQQFLARQRRNRLDRVHAIADRLAAAGAAIDIEPLVSDADRHDGRSIGRPQVARALVAAGHASTTNEAFERWLSRGRPAFVPRAGANPEQVIGIIHDASGLASIAHPGIAHVDDRIPSLKDAGLDALEAYHSDHDDAARDRYLALARDLNLLVTGGSDYHGDPAHGLNPGDVTLPAHEWERLSAWPRRSLR